MTFTSGGQFEGGRVRKGSGGRGGGGRQGGGHGRGIAVGGGIGALVIGALVVLLSGGGLDDVLGLLDDGTQQQQQAPPGQDAYVKACTAEQANIDRDCRYAATLHSLDTYWERELPAQTGVAYVEPPAESFSGSTVTGCGAASSSTGPFYCPADQTVYMDVSFFDLLSSQFGASGGPLAEMYVIAHEVGHHIEHLTGVLSAADRRSSGAESDTVRVELMADCLAGMWVGAASREIDPDTGVPYLEPITEAQLADALSAAAAVGDDHIQQQTSGQIHEGSFTHGTSEQRQRWFMTGYDGGTFDACNTFEAASL